ncbi:hypothetical protein EIV80_15930, partial [Salmonella enterica]|nr:hypothetical protein [Salmonella enterica]
MLNDNAGSRGQAEMHTRAITQYFLVSAGTNTQKRTRRSILIYKVFLTTDGIKNDLKNHENKKC